MADDLSGSLGALSSVAQVGSWLAEADHAGLLSFAGALGLSVDAQEFALDASYARTECFRILAVSPGYARAALAHCQPLAEARGEPSSWASVLPSPTVPGAGTIRFDVPADIDAETESTCE